ncbi:MAG: phenylacetate--CoA ligase family protein [Nitrososphaerales archaeon]
MPQDVYFNEGREKLPRSEIEEAQSKLFRQTLNIAYNNSLFYRRRFDSAGISPADISGIDDLQKIKLFTTKEDLRTAYPFGMLTVPRESVVEVHASSGTTGTPTLGLHTRKDLESWGEISARSLVMSGLNQRDIFQITPSLGMFSGGFGFYHGARKIGAMIVPASAGFSKRQIQFMIDFGTTMLSAIVSYALRLAEIAHEMGVEPAKDTKVRKGIFGSEIWTKEMKQKISRIWDLEPYDIYGFTELYGPGVGNDCRVHDGLHMWEDHFLVEVIDPETGEIVGPEEEGELVFTTLTKEAMPLIRYRSRDISKLYASSSCDCGRTHQRYGQIRARSDDMIKISGVNFWPSMIESVLLREPRLGPEYRIRVSRVDFNDRMSIEVESRELIQSLEAREDLQRKLSAELQSLLLFSPEISIVDPNSLPRVEVGKMTRIIDERKNTSS